MSKHVVEELYPECCEAMRAFFDDCYKLFLAKQHDRGPENIARFGDKGIVIRMEDKQSRIKRIIWDGIEPQVSEPVEEEFKDQAVYAGLATVVRAGKWGK